MIKLLNWKWLTLAVKYTYKMSDSLRLIELDAIQKQGYCSF